MVTNMLFMAFSKRDLNINSWQDLRNHEVAYLRGQAWTTNKLNKLEMDENLHPVATGTQALKMVAAGRTDIAIVEKNFGDALIRSSEELSTLNVSVILDEIKIYPYIHKKHAALVPALIRSLQGMQEDGSFQRISAQANGN